MVLKMNMFHHPVCVPRNGTDPLDPMPILLLPRRKSELLEVHPASGLVSPLSLAMLRRFWKSFTRLRQRRITHGPVPTADGYNATTVRQISSVTFVLTPVYNDLHNGFAVGFP